MSAKFDACGFAAFGQIERPAIMAIPCYHNQVGAGSLRRR